MDTLGAIKEPDAKHRAVRSPIRSRRVMLALAIQEEMARIKPREIVLEVEEELVEEDGCTRLNAISLLASGGRIRCVLRDDACNTRTDTRVDATAMFEDGGEILRCDGGLHRLQ